MADPRRRTFGPTVLVGLAGAGLAAVSGNRAAATVSSTNDDGDTGTALSLVQHDAHQPLVTALGLVVLACWGVVLVTRGRVRRVVAVLAVVASAGALVAAVSGLVTEPGRLHDAVMDLGATGVDTRPTAWAVAAVVGSLLAVLAGLRAVRHAPSWPEMGARYDAPGGADVPDKAPEEQSNLDLWKAMDEGRDPTA
ncbi:Trp biosynthesis-associated membrane protein [Nocardioides mangrovi]|uniref:Trp biosynthesis-associated membrane protein n=1 Tax=Nocardioides mangrovi TaxID=2874580 RepID=A0ABS7U779_9ACTN|nr:Trp biosynthesis-associated membrane protein [Nocardioides mangrovi]MBZ5736848.1 Trp biosynthesis-associated membrane protein [Nocardioides mangrovi]